MCVNYRPATPAQLQNFFKVRPGSFQTPAESFPGYAAPIILGDEAIKACFGLIPHWSKDTKLSRHTYNARSETVAEKPSFRQAWQRGQFCLVPMQAFYEPNYESGVSVRWKIERQDQLPFAVAGLWDRWVSPTHEVVHSFTMLTINADAHPLMRRFHKPDEEKRTIAILAPDHWEAWQKASPEEAMQLLQGAPPDEFHALAAPLAIKARASSSTSSDTNVSNSGNTNTNTSASAIAKKPNLGKQSIDLFGDGQ